MTDNFALYPTFVVPIEIEKESLLDLTEKILDYVYTACQDQEKGDFNLIINSDGGCALSAFTFSNFLVNLPCVVNTYAMGACQSGAVDIFLAGDNRFVFDGTLFYMHDFSITIPSSELLEEAKKYIGNVEDMSFRNLKYILSRVDIDSEMLQEKINKNWYINNNELIKYGFAHQVIGV